MKGLLTGLLIIGAISVIAQNTEPKFIKNSYYDGTSVLVNPGISNDDMVKIAAEVRPSARQVRWQQYGMLGFVHFNLNTFTGREWGTGHENLSIFNPAGLDADQWVATFKSAGIQSVIMVCKHHDGFCLWPSTSRERTIAQTPYKNGKGDIVREFIDACRKEGIKTCIYYSPWDKQEPYGKLEYNDLMINELTELLTRYGNIDLVWFDGAGIDPKTSGVKMDFDWPRIYNTIRTLQPQALISGAGPDIRWVGNEGGRGRFTEWSVQGIHLPEADFSGFDSQVPLMAANLGHIEQLQGAKQLAWYPARGGLPIRYGWFWKEGQQLRTLQYMVNSYFETVGQNSNVLVNLSPDNHGLIPSEDVVLMKTFGEYLSAMFKKNYTDGAVAKASSVREGGYAANYLFDDDLRTCWLAPEDESKGEILVDLYGVQSFNVVKLQENIVDFGQRIEEFEVDAWINSAWKIIGKGTTVGIRRLLRVEQTKTNKLRLRITKSRMSPSLATLELYFAPQIKEGPEITQNKKGEILINGNGLPIYYTVDNTSPFGEKAELYRKPFRLPVGGYVRAIAGDRNSGNWSSESSKTIGIESQPWKIKGGDESRYLADYDPATSTEFDLTEKNGGEILIELNRQTKLSGFSYLPPQGAPNEPGRVESYTFYTKNENGKWIEVCSGDFGNIDNNPIEQTVNFKDQIISHEIKIVINRATRKQTVAKVADLRLF
ncbi:alpha-L-fucosidase [uncultured Sunxiuqinia sp.]|uniref:alpha-L-fucosidase n=1 Tax=uncultured Sunxiuqinia sp. TaxID=1573825 RepID=UPI00262EE8A7|nr:alpha-L-fucosidase [uncultured Sunxiuqinia sp.]